jgi:hypothetical protein
VTAPRPHQLPSTIQTEATQHEDTVMNAFSAQIRVSTIQDLVSLSVPDPFPSPRA